MRAFSCVRRCRDCRVHHHVHVRGACALSPRHWTGICHSVARTDGRFVRQHLAVVCAGGLRPRRRCGLRNHAGAQARRVGGNVPRAPVRRDRSVRRAGRLDRRQHLAVRRADERTPGALGEHAAAAVTCSGGSRRTIRTPKKSTSASKASIRCGSARRRPPKLLAAHNRGEADKYVFLDVRENAEQSMGSLKGATVVRFPDLKKANLDLTNKTVILFCHNGNRSSETGRSNGETWASNAKFVVGGLEKWMVEGRDMTGMSARDLASLRAIPEYPQPEHPARHRPGEGDDRKGQSAIFVDIRYPTEFAASHIAGRDQPQPSPHADRGDERAHRQAAEAADHSALLRSPRLLLRAKCSATS